MDNSVTASYWCVTHSEQTLCNTLIFQSSILFVLASVSSLTMSRVINTMSLVYLQYVVLDSAYSYVSAEAWAKERSSDLTVQVLADSAKDDFCHSLRINTSDSDVDVKIYKARNSTFRWSSHFQSDSSPNLSSYQKLKTNASSSSVNMTRNISPVTAVCCLRKLLCRRTLSLTQRSFSWSRLPVSDIHLCSRFTSQLN